MWDAGLDEDAPCPPSLIFCERKIVVFKTTLKVSERLVTIP